MCFLNGGHFFSVRIVYTCSSLGFALTHAHACMCSAYTSILLFEFNVLCCMFVIMLCFSLLNKLPFLHQKNKYVAIKMWKEECWCFRMYIYFYCIHTDFNIKTIINLVGMLKLKIVFILHSRCQTLLIPHPPASLSTRQNNTFRHSFAVFTLIIGCTFLCGSYWCLLKMRFWHKMRKCRKPQMPMWYNKHLTVRSAFHIKITIIYAHKQTNKQK